MAYLLVFLLPFVYTGDHQGYQWIELSLNETTRAETFQHERVTLIERALSNGSEEIWLARPLLVRLSIVSAELYPLKYLKSINNKLFPISFDRLKTNNESENLCDSDTRQHAFCGYDHTDWQTAQPVKGFCCEECLNGSCVLRTSCVAKDDLWYDVYAIDPHHLYLSVTLYIYELNDDFNWELIMKSDMNDATSADQTTNISQIQFNAQQMSAPSMSPIELNEKKYLLVRRLSSERNQTTQVEAEDQSKDLNGAFMVVDKSELNLEEEEICTKPSDTTDQSQCTLECSNQQPLDIWLADKTNELSKQPTRHALHPLLEFPIYQHQTQLHLLFPVQQQLQMQIKLKQRQSIGLKCSVSIVEISVESFAESTFHVALVLNNTGLSSCSLHFALEQRKNSDFITEEHFQEFHISPMYQQLIYFTLSARKRSRSLPIRMQVTVRESSSNATVAERDVLIKHGHHCTCISRCQCRCLENTWIPTALQLQCIHMSKEDINRAGFSQSDELRISSVHTPQEDPIRQLTNEQSRYVRKWFLFIAVFALSLHVLLVVTIR